MYKQKDTKVVLEALALIARQFGLTMELPPECLDELAKLMDWLKRCGEGEKKLDIVSAIDGFFQALLRSRPVWKQPGAVETLKDIQEANEQISNNPVPKTCEEACQEVHKRADFIRLFAKSNLPVELMAGMMMYWPTLKRKRIMQIYVNAKDNDKKEIRGYENVAR